MPPSEECYKVIEGDWNEFRFRRALPADYDAVCEHLANNYFQDEITSNLFGSSKEFAENFNRITRVIMDDGMSFVCEHVPTEKIAGVRITADHKPDTSYSHIKMENREANLFFKYIVDTFTLADFNGKYGIDSWVEFAMASTARDFRGHGIVGEFYRRSIEFLKAAGFKHVVVICTSPWTRRATEKHGFVELATLNHKDFLDFDGKPVFTAEAAGDNYGVAKIKVL